MKIGIGNDHAAYQMKKEIVAYLQSLGHEVINVGTDSKESCHGQIYCYKVAKMVVNGQVDRGIVICGTGVGLAMAANKVKGIRCCLCSEPYTARLSRLHNDTNMLAFGARVIGVEIAKMIVDEWLNTEFEDGQRHRIRLSMVKEIEETQSLKAAQEE